MEASRGAGGLGSKTPARARGSDFGSNRPLRTPRAACRHPLFTWQRRSGRSGGLLLAPFFFPPSKWPSEYHGEGKSIRDGPWVGAKAKGGERSVGPRALKGVPPEP